jgi:hypothetical protein
MDRLVLSSLPLTISKSGLLSMVVIFSIPSGADIDKFGLDGKDNNVLHFDSTDFEARENNTAPKRLGSFKRSLFPLVNPSSK